MEFRELLQALRENFVEVDSSDLANQRNEVAARILCAMIATAGDNEELIIATYSDGPQLAVDLTDRLLVELSK